ncbi:lytic transglycosylase domain-containing protein, partial [Pseudanabaena biceps]|nr:lytic transglycosylase domain-containing protein [Pseudanabaena biceps]
MTIGAVNGPGGVEAAIRRAAGATGVDSDFLIRTARRESSLNPAA